MDDIHNNDQIDLNESNFEVLYPSDNDLEYPQKHFSLEREFFNEEEQEDQLWKARTGLNEDTLSGAIETIIFMSDRPVSLMKIKNLIDQDMPLRVLHSALTRLQEEYEESHHGIRLLEVAEGYQFRTKATYAKYVQDFFKANSLVLSPTALEILAVIAYKQPVSKTVVDKIRGVDSSHIVRTLMDKRLVKVTGRSNDIGRPALYGTTTEFLEVFNLASLDELPPEHELEEMSKSNVADISEIKTIVHSGDKKRFVFDEIDELDELSESIKSISPETPFIKSLKVEEKKRTNEKGELIKTAYDILEEYVLSNQIKEQNKISSLSELFTGIVDPEIVRDLLMGPHNAPEENDDDDFQMIDLDSGEVIETKEVVEENAPVELFGTSEEEKESLASALDDAFAKLTADNDEVSELKDDLDLTSSSEKTCEKEDEIDKLNARISEEAKDFDLDLSFLESNEGPVSDDSENLTD